MFTGCVHGCFPVKAFHRGDDGAHLTVSLDNRPIAGLREGLSVSVDGVALTAVKLGQGEVFFHVTKEDLSHTTLVSLSPGKQVNLERSLLFGEAVHEHMLSGHVLGRARLSVISEADKSRLFTFECPRAWMKYLPSRGFVALDGVGFTIEEARREGFFSVVVSHDISQSTNYRFKTVDDEVNLEVDPYTLIIVGTVQRLCLEKPQSMMY